MCTNNGKVSISYTSAEFNILADTFSVGREVMSHFILWPRLVCVVSLPKQTEDASVFTRFNF